MEESSVDFTQRGPVSKVLTTETLGLEFGSLALRNKARHGSICLKS